MFAPNSLNVTNQQEQITRWTVRCFLLALLYTTGSILHYPEGK